MLHSLRKIWFQWSNYMLIIMSVLSSILTQNVLGIWTPGTVILTREVKDGLYQIRHNLKTTISGRALWHDCIGHPHLPMIQQVIHSTKKTMKFNSSYELCSTCQLGKSHRLPTNNVHIKPSKTFDIIHVDL